MKTEQKLDAVIESIVEAVKAGVLLKNIKRGLLNNGTPEKMADKLTRIAELRASEFLANCPQ